MIRLITALMIVMTASVNATNIAQDPAGSGNVTGSLNSHSGNNNSNNDSSTTEVNGNTYNGSTVTNSKTEVRNTPGAVAPTVTSGYDTCSQSISGGASGPGFGISYGQSVKDETCEMIKLSKLLHTLGLTDGAMAILMQDERTASAIRVAYPQLAAKFDPKWANYSAEERAILAKGYEKNVKVDNLTVTLP